MFVWLFLIVFWLFLIVFDCFWLFFDCFLIVFDCLLLTCLLHPLPCVLRVLLIDTIIMKYGSCPVGSHNGEYQTNKLYDTVSIYKNFDIVLFWFSYKFYEIKWNNSWWIFSIWFAMGVPTHIENSWLCFCRRCIPGTTLPFKGVCAIPSQTYALYYIYI